MNDYIYVELNLSADAIVKNLIKIIGFFDEFSVDDVLIEVEATQEQEIAA